MCARWLSAVVTSSTRESEVNPSRVHRSAVRSSGLAWHRHSLTKPGPLQRYCGDALIQRVSLSFIVVEHSTFHRFVFSSKYGVDPLEFPSFRSFCSTTISATNDGTNQLLEMISSAGRHGEYSLYGSECLNINIEPT